MVKFPKKIQRSIDEWYHRTEPVRKCVHRMLKEYANGWYQGGAGKNRNTQPLNLIDRGVQIIAPFLVTNNPRCMINPRYGANKPGLKSFAVTLELALAHLFEEIKLSQRTLRPVVIDSLFGMGITKTGVAPYSTVELGGYTHDIGQPYCDRINFNDYFGDIAARNREEMMIEGNRYRLPLEYIAESGLFKHYDKLTSDIKRYGETDPKTIVDGQEYEYKELRQTIELQDIWLPKENIMITLPMEGQGDRIMRTVEWEGPEDGPYDTLFYKNFPDSIIPIPPVYVWLDINKTVNIMVKKMVENCEREKSLGIYQLEDDDSAERIKDAIHGDLLGLANPDTIKEITIGGFNPQSKEFLEYLEHQFAISYSNLYGIGGKASQAGTLGQEQMLQYNATRALDDMVDQFQNFTRSIIRKLAWYLWTDPLIKIPMVRRVENIDLSVTYSEEEREGDFLDYSFDIDPYSLARINPELKQQKLMQLVQGLIIPLAPLAAQQGETINVGKITKDAGKFLNMPEIEEWWESAVPQEGVNPYGPEQGTVGSASTGQAGGKAEGELTSRLSNLNQQQSSSRGGKPSPSNKEKK